MKNSLNPDVIANGARMRRALFKGTLLYVEGESDERLFGMFVNHDQCQIIIAHTRSNVIEACRILETAGFPGAIGIVDADFEHIEGKVGNLRTVFSTDVHDIECLMLLSTAFDRLLFQFVSHEKLKTWQTTYKRDIRTHLAQMAACIGCFLWHSLRSVPELKLTFEGLDPGQFVDSKSLEINLHQLVTHVKNKSLRQDLVNAELLAGIEARLPTPSDLWQVVRGHDFIDILSFALRKTIGSWPSLDVRRERLEQSLRLAYSKEHFTSTQLFSKLQAWVAINPPFVIFAQP